MGKRNPGSQGKHYHMLTSLVKHLIHEGYTDIESALGGFTHPHEMRGRDGKPYISDVIAWKNGVKHVFEVETSETISLPYTKNQFGAFYDDAKHSEGVFSVIVPKQSEEEAKAVLKELNMPDAEVWTM